MLTILFNLPSQPPSLIAGYDDGRQEMASYLGYGSDESLWTTGELAELDRRVQEAYRWVLYPATIPGERVSHVWSHLRQVTTLSTVAAQQAYELPAVVGSVEGAFTYPASTGYSPIRQTSEQDVRSRQSTGLQTGHPILYAIRWLVQTPGLNQRQEVLFWPIPDGVYVLTYSRAIVPERLSKTNPYPLGGPRQSQLFIEACKAIGEAAKDGARGDQWTLFMDRLMEAVTMDRGTMTEPTVGTLGGMDSLDYVTYGPTIGQVTYIP